MEIFATLIATAANVKACRSAQTGAGFYGRYSTTGAAPATHYVSSGRLSQADIDALAGLCVITTGDHDPHAVIAAAGLQIVSE